MSGHTPGPWFVPETILTKVFARDEKGIMTICDIRGWGHLTGKGAGAHGLSEDAAIAIQDANASLIAAAPDLLEACKEFYAIHTADCGNAQEFRDRLQMARVLAANAIAKAEGK